MRNTLVVIAALATLAVGVLGVLFFVSPESRIALSPAPAVAGGNAATEKQGGDPADPGKVGTNPRKESGASDSTDSGAPNPEGPQPLETGDEHISGTVADGEGKELAGVEIEVFFQPKPKDAPRWVQPPALSAAPTSKVTADAEGKFRVEGLAKGQVLVRLSLAGFYGDEKNPVAVDTGSEGLIFVMHQGGSVRGTVRDVAGSPVADVSILWLAAEASPGNSVNAVTGADGTYHLLGVQAGSMQLWAQHNDYATEILPLELEVGETLTDVDIVLDAGLTIRGIVIDTAGVGIEGAAVSAREGQHGAGKSHTATTGADGSFEVKGLDLGMMWLSATHKDYLASEAKAFQAGTDDVELTLKRGMRLTGIVYDPSGKPVAGAQVTASTLPRSSPMRWRGNSSSTSSPTGENGEFELPGLAPGEFEVWAKKQGLRESERLSLTLEETAAAPERIELRLREGVSIKGTVVDAAGKGIDGASVSASEVSESEPGFEGAYVSRTVFSGTDDGSAQSATAATDGSFVLEGLAAGSSYHLTASKEGFVDPNKEVTAESTTAPATGVILTLQIGASVSGVVLDPSGVPFEGASIQLVEKGASRWGGGGSRNTGQSGANGEFHLPGVVEGSYEIFADHEDYQRSEKLEITLAVGEKRDGVQLPLLVGGQITGRVVSEDGEPIGGASISAWNQAAMMSGGGDPSSATSEPDGSFVLKGIGSGTFTVSANASGFVSQNVAGFGGGNQLTAKAGEFVTVTLSRGATIIGQVVDETRQPVTSFSVEILVSRPQWGGGEFPTKSEDISAADGHFEIVGVEEGVTSVRVSATGFAPKQTPIASFDAKGVNDVGVVELSAGATLRGVVMTATGNPAAAASVSATPAEKPGGASAVRMMFSGMGAATVPTDERGEFLLEHVPAGPHTVKATHEQFVTASLDVDVPEKGERAGLRLVMATGSAIIGTATDGAGEPMKGIAITALSQAGGMRGMGDGSKNTSTDAEGHYRLGGLSAGKYMVSANLQAGTTGFTQSTKNVDVPESGEVVCDFTQDALCRLFGKVRGLQPTGEDDGMAATGMGNMAVLFSMSGGGVNQTMTQIEEDGSYSFTPMPPGDYKIMLFGSTTFPITLPAAQELRFDVELPTASVAGRVRRSDDEAITMAQVHAMRREPGNMLSRFAQTMSGENGAFKFKNMKDGIYDIYAEISGFGTGKAEGIDVTGGRSVSGVEIIVSSGNTLTVTVLDGDGEPARTATLWCEDAHGNPVGINGLAQTGQGNEAGEQVIENLPVGVYRVTAGSPTGGTAWHDGVQVSVGTQNRAQIRLPSERGRVKVTVTRAGAPAAGAAVELTEPSGRAVMDMSGGLMAVYGGTSTGADGVYESGLLPSGSYQLRVTLGTAERRIEVAIPADGSVKEIELQL